MQEKKITLYQWLDQKHLSIKQFCNLVGCNREIPRNIEHGKPVSLKIALAITIFTKGEISPTVKNVGRPKLYKHSNIT